MVRKTHNGRPGYQWLPADWGSRLRLAANQKHNAQCEIRGPAVNGVFDPVSGTYVTTPGALKYSGACSVERQASGEQLAGLVSEQALSSIAYLISVDRESPVIEERDLVTITEEDDVQLVGQVFPVRAVLMGSLRATRDLYCSDDLTT